MSQLTEQDLQPHPDKFCAQCKKACPPAGGMNFVSGDQSQHRWICKQCRERLEQRVSKLL